MFGFKKVFAILAITHITILCLVIYYFQNELAPKAEGPSLTFLLVKEMNIDDEDLNEEGLIEADIIQDNEEIIYIESEKENNFSAAEQEFGTGFETGFDSGTNEVTKTKTKYNPFELLGAYPDPDPYITEPAYDKPHYALIHDDEYCNKVDMHNLEHPENMFTTMNFYTDFFPGSVMKDLVISRLGRLFMPYLDRWMPMNWRQSRFFSLDPNITIFHITADQFYKYHKIGKHYLCATQMFNHIPNHTDIIAKDHFPQSIQNYLLKYKDKPQCFEKNTIYPMTYRLFIQSECQEFFELINSQQYNDSLQTEPIQYLVKIGHGAHMAQGVFLLYKEEAEEINDDFDFGRKCGQVENSLIVQKYITNPMLLNNNNKFHMRVYVLIASTNPTIAYYHDGYLRASIFPFDKFSEDRATHLTNLLTGNKVAMTLNQSSNNITTGNDKTAKQLEDFYIWSFEDLEKYLIESGKTNDTNWLNNTLRPALQKTFVHVVRMTSAPFWKESNVYELLGCDFMLDDDMNLWFLEANPNPLLDGVQTTMITQMLIDMFEIQYAYYRSRMQRVLEVIKNMQIEIGDEPVGDLDKWKKLYQEAVKNRLEPEYEIKKTNSWTLIMDKGLPGAQAYFGHIPEECVY